jgi:hypothetical protein
MLIFHTSGVVHLSIHIEVASLSAFSAAHIALNDFDFHFEGITSGSDFSALGSNWIFGTHCP